MAKKYLDDTGLAYLWTKITTALSGKVNTENGKGLSSNDYTTDEKNKLSNIASGAQVNVLEGIQVAGTSVTPVNKIANVPAMTGASSGAAGTAGVVPAPASGKQNKFLRGDGSWEDPPGEVYTSTSPISISSSNVISHSTSGVTAASKGDTTNQTPSFGSTFKVLSGTVNSTGHLTAFAEHTVKIPNATASTSAAGLMSSDDKTKLNGIASGAEANVQSDWNQTSTTADDYIKNKPTIPTVDAYITSTSENPVQSKAIYSALVGYVSTTEVGAASGVCPLNSSSKVDSTYLPSYVDDVIEAYARSGQTALSSTWLSATSGGAALTPETGKIYILMADSGSYSANDTFRWSGSTYVKLADGGVSAITTTEIETICS